MGTTKVFQRIFAVEKNTAYFAATGDRNGRQNFKSPTLQIIVGAHGADIKLSGSKGGIKLTWIPQLELHAHRLVLKERQSQRQTIDIVDLAKKHRPTK